MGVGVLVPVAVGVSVGCLGLGVVASGVGEAVSVGAAVGVSVGKGVSVGVGVGVSVGVDVGVNVGTGVWVAVGVGGTMAIGGNCGNCARMGIDIWEGKRLACGRKNNTDKMIARTGKGNTHQAK